jgi:hypothetical protein
MKTRITIFIVCITFLLPVYLSARDTVYYYGANNRLLPSSEDARISRSVKQVTGSCFRFTERIKTSEGWKLKRKDRIRTKKDGVQKIWRTEQTLFPRTFERLTRNIHGDLYYFKESKSGKVIREGYSKSIIPLHLDGKITEYYPNGNVKSESIYTENRLLSNKNFYPDGSEYIHNVFYSVDQPPRYLYGAAVFKQFVMERIAEVELPIHEINDKVVIGAVVMESGELTGIKVLEGKIPSVNSFLAETMELLPGKWEPAQLNGEEVRYFIEIPFNFSNELSTLQYLEFSKDGQQLFWNL